MEDDCVGQFLMAVGNWIYDFQTLITGLLAIGAAWIAATIAKGQLEAAKEQIHVAREQIAAGTAEADQVRKRRLRAVRATLPVTLSSICEYSQAVGSQLAASWPVAAKLYADTGNGMTKYLIKAELPDIPFNQLESLELVLEFSDVEEVSLRIESIMREMQVLSSRIAPLRCGDEISTDWLAGMIIQAATLYARAESLFTYARGKAPSVNTAPLWDRVFAALNIMRIYNIKVLETAKAQKDRGDEPGEADSEEPI